MNTNKNIEKNIKILIIVFTIIIIGISIMLININLNNVSKPIMNEMVEDNAGNEYQNNISNQIKPGVYEELYKQDTTIPKKEVLPNTLSGLYNINEYFVVKDILYSYFYNCHRLSVDRSAFINNIYEENLSPEEREEYINLEVVNEQKISADAIYNMLADKYVSEYGITKANIKEKFKITYDYKTIIDKIYFIKKTEDICSYLVFGTNRDITNEKNLSFSILITTDLNKNAFCIWPQEYIEKHKYNTLKEGDKLEVTLDYIGDKNYNKFNYKSIEDSQICKEYFENYKYSMLYNLNGTYDKLNKEYAEKRFGNKESFNEYINENHKRIVLSYLDKYAKISDVNYTEYRCIDINNNTCIFRIYKDVKKYEVFLDDYTILPNSDILQYNKERDMNKAKYQLDKFIKKVNTKDYNAIYNNLDSTFKNNNFESIDKLKEYINTNFYNLNEIELLDSDKRFKNYIFECKITNVENSEETKEMNVIIELKEDMDFTISFSFK